MKRSNRWQKKSKRKSLNGRNLFQFTPADYLLSAIVLILTIFGVVMVYNTSVVVAYEQFGDQYWFLKNQGIWAIIGISLAFVISGLRVELWEKYAPILFGISILLLVLVLIPGFSAEVYGAHQRLIIPGLGISIQPSEIVKLTLIMYLAYLFVNTKRNKQPFPYKQFIAVLVVSAGLTAIEPDLGGAILISSSAFVLFIAAGANILISIGLLLFGGGGAGLYSLLANYRSDRITDFIKVFTDPDNVSYHVNQIFIALGSGGLLGLGLGNSRQKYQYVPEVTTDSIFAIIGEEVGFLGALLVIIALLFIIWRGINIAEQSQNEFSRLLALGITANIGFQALVNIGGMVGVMPLTGVPLPFVSYGGSSLTFLLISIGMLLSISRSNK